MEPVWIGVDLDGTLAYYDGWRGPEHIGLPIEPMLERVRGWIKEGKRVKIFTARASVESHIQFVKSWVLQLGLGYLEVTNCKDFGMIELWDDRCVRVMTNEGVPCCIR